MHFPQLPPQCLRTPCHRPRTTRIQHPWRHKEMPSFKSLDFFQKKKLRHVEASTLRLGKAERLTVATERFFGRNTNIVSKIKTSNCQMFSEPPPPPWLRNHGLITLHTLFDMNLWKNLVLGDVYHMALQQFQ